MLKIRAWQKWQGEALYDRLRKRAPSGRTKPISLAFIAAATNLDDESGNFYRFSLAVGGGIMARGYLLAVLGYVGRNSPTTGVIRCDRDQLGPVVLTDRMTQVSAKQGACVYDALIEAGIAEEIAQDDIREIVPPGSPPPSPPSSREPSREASREPSPPSSGRRGEERRGEDFPPLPPVPGGEPDFVRPSEHAALRPRDRERLGKVLEYVVRCGTLRERDEALGIRSRFKGGILPDAEIAELLQRKFAHVTPEKLARFLGPLPQIAGA